MNLTRGWLRATLMVLALLGGLSGGAGAARALDRAAVAQSLIAEGDRLLAAYDPADGAVVADGFSELYFEQFEASGLEAAIGARDPGRKLELEAQFSRLIGLAMQSAAPADVMAAWQALRGGLAAIAAEHSGPVRGWSVFLELLLILVREGFEALLVVAALAAWVRRSGTPAQLRLVYRGVGWAVAASLLTALAVNRVLALGGPGQEALEGVTVLLAAAVLFAVSCWLFAHSAAGRWQRYLQSQVTEALSGGRAYALELAVFLAVYREGAETVLFYQALALSNPGQGAMLAGGIAAGLLGLAGGYWLLSRLSLRVPLRPFFAGTALLLFALSLTFVGQGVLELQEARWLAATPVAWLPQLPWLGLFPTAEGAAGQAALLGLTLLIWLWLKARDAGEGGAR